MQSLPNDEPLDPKFAALTPPLPRKNSASRSPETYRKKQNSQERIPFVNDYHTGNGYPRDFHSQNSYDRTPGAFIGQGHSQGHSSLITQGHIPHGGHNTLGRQSSVSDNSVIELNSEHASVYSSQMSHSGIPKTSFRERPEWDTRHLDKDVNFQYLKHVVMKFMLSRETEVSVFDKHKTHT